MPKTGTASACAAPSGLSQIQALWVLLVCDYFRLVISLVFVSSWYDGFE